MLVDDVIGRTALTDFAVSAGKRISDALELIEWAKITVVDEEALALIDQLERALIGE